MRARAPGRADASGERSGTQRRARGEQGTITFWILGLCCMLLLLGGISLDLWRGFSERRALAAAADAAALAGATGIHEGWFRATGEVILDPTVARARAEASLRDQGDVAALRAVHINATHTDIVVETRGTVELTLLRLASSPGPLDVVVRATARPARSP